MKILQLVTVRQRRGAEVFATQLADALISRGAEVIVVGLLPPPSDPLTPERAEVVDLVSRSESRFDPVRLRELTRLILRLRPDLVQANGSQTFKYGALARRFVGPRFPLIYRNISVASHWIRNPAQRLLGRWLARSVDHVSSVSEATSLDFGVTYGVAPERRSVIRRGILIPARIESAVARQRLTELAQLPPDARILLHTGSFSEEKNHAWLIDTFAEIREQRPDVHLFLIGDGELRPSVEERVATLGLANSVHLLGVRRDAAELVAGADLFVLPSRIEGVPGVVLEAAAQQVPAVATNVGGMAEAIVDGSTGVLVPLDDRPAFVRAVLELLANEEERQRLGCEARKLVSERFSMDATAAAFEDLYGRLVREHRP